MTIVDVFEQLSIFSYVSTTFIKSCSNDDLNYV